MKPSAAHARDIASQLRGLLGQARTDQVPLPADGEDLLLREAGLSSLDMVTFLVLIEDHFGINFDDDLAEDTLGSLNSIADYLADIGA
jgi:acyl carrier protein